MGSLRGRVTRSQRRGLPSGQPLGKLPRATALCLAVALFPQAALAEVCNKARPLWNPAEGPASALDEALHFAASPVSVVLLLATAVALRFRSPWGGLAAVCGWSALVFSIVFGDARDLTGVGPLARAEGCIGSPALFIALVAAICVGTVVYTAPGRGGK